MKDQLWNFVCIDCDRQFDDPNSADIHITILDHTVKGGKLRK